MIRGCYLLAPLLVCAVSISTPAENKHTARLLQEQGPARLLSLVPVEEGTLRISLTDNLPLIVEISGSDALEVRVAQPIIGAGVWREASRSAISRESLKGKAARWQQTCL